MILFLTRHGQTVANLEAFYSGQSDVKLTELGKSQAEAIRPVLAKYQFDKVYSSDLSRAIDTAQLAIPGCEPITTPLLREISIGKLTGEYIGAVRERYGNLKGDFSAFDGESPAMLKDRAAQFLQLMEKETAETVIAFSHNGFMKAVLRCIIGDAADTVPFVNGNCNIAVLKYENGRWLIPVWNLAGNF